MGDVKNSPKIKKALVTKPLRVAQQHTSTKKPDVKKTMITLTEVIRFIAIISDVLMFICFAYFISGLRWSRESDRPSVVGFCWMMTSIVISICFMLA